MTREDPPCSAKCGKFVRFLQKQLSNRFWRDIAIAATVEAVRRISFPCTSDQPTCRIDLQFYRYHAARTRSTRIQHVLLLIYRASFPIINLGL